MSGSLRSQAEKAFRAGLEQIDPRRLIEGKVRLEGDVLHVGNRLISLAGLDRIFVVAFGKAACRMVGALEDVLAGRIAEGVVLSNSFPEELPPKYRTFECTHPLPSARNVAATKVVLDLAAGAGGRDLVICLISGGGSAILTAPATGISLEELSETMRLLLQAGAPISQLNAVRKHLSTVKGGLLLRAVHPARTLSLVLSDVPRDDLSVIASGPTSPDPTTFADALAAAESLGVADKLPASVAARLRAGAAGEIEETPKPGNPLFMHCDNVLIGRNGDMLAAVERHLRSRGFWTLQEAGHFEGEARELGSMLAKRALELDSRLPDSSRPYALIAGGESTVTVHGDGVGGRNCELALAAAIEFRGCRRCALLAAGTDGIDGPTDAAGAAADGETLDRAETSGMDPLAALEGNDSYTFFQRAGGLISTGPTGTNLMDVVLILIGK